MIVKTLATDSTSSAPAPPSGGLSPTNSSDSTPNAAATVIRFRITAIAGRNSERRITTSSR